MLEIVFLNGARAGQSSPANRNLIAGRGADCELVVPDPNASRHHCLFRVDGANLTVRDSGSANGTYVNEVRIGEQPVPLAGDDVVRIGQTNLRVRSLAKENVGEETTLGFVESKEDDPAAFQGSVLLDLSQIPQQRPTERLAERLNAIIKVSKALVNIREFDRVANGILEALFDVFPQADRGLLMLGSDVSSLAAQAVRSRGKTRENMVVSKSICRTAIEKRRAILFTDSPGGGQDFELGKSVYMLGIRSAMVVPLIVEDDILGLLQIDTPNISAAFVEEDLELAAAVCQQASIALHNAQLLRKVEQEATNRRNLARFLPGAMVEQVLEGKLDLALGGKTCKGTVLFSDIVGFTSISDGRQPEEVVAFMNGYFSRMVPCIEQLGGSVDKFMGDAIMAVWDVPIEKPGSVLRAAQAAIGMQNALVGFSGGEVAGWPVLQMGIGVNSGRVVAGNIGSDDRLSYTVLGDAVNTAQRLEASAGRGQILVSRSTWTDLRGQGVGVLMPPLKVKNKAEPLDTFSLRGVRTPDGEIALHVPVLSGKHPVWLIRRLGDETFVALAPKEAQLADDTLVSRMPEWPDVVLGKPTILDVLPAQSSDGGYTRCQIQLTDPTLKGLIAATPIHSVSTWEQMPRR